MLVFSLQIALPALCRLRGAQHFGCLLAQPVLIAGLIEFEEQDVLGVIGAGVDDWCRGNLHDAGDAIIPTGRKQLTAQTRFGLELVELDHQICKFRWVAGQSMQLNSLKRFTCIEKVS